MRKLDSNAHSVFLLYYHLILVVKYRKKVLNDPISNRAKEIFEHIAPNYHITLEEWNHDQDNVHIMFRAHPKSELSKFINAYKSASSRLIKKEYPEVRQKLWKEMFWSQSFCLLSAGGAPIEVIRQYIETQGEGKSEHRVPCTVFGFIRINHKGNYLQRHLVVFVLFITGCLRRKKLTMRKRERT